MKLINEIKYPHRRKLINDNLKNNSHLLNKGIVLDIGGERNTTGGFALPKILGKYIILNFEMKHKPDVIGNATDLPIKTSSIDSVLLIETLEHTLYPEKVILEISRILKPNGYLIFSMPFLYKIHSTSFDYQRYTHLKIENMFSKYNLRIVQLKITGYFFTTIYDLWKTALAKARKSIALFCLLLQLGLTSLIFLRCLILLENTKLIQRNEL